MCVFERVVTLKERQRDACEGETLSKTRQMRTRRMRNAHAFIGQYSLRRRQSGRMLCCCIKMRLESTLCLVVLTHCARNAAS